MISSGQSLPLYYFIKMIKKIPNLEQSSKATKFSKKTLKYIQKEVFFKLELSEAQKITDEAFFVLLRSEACEDTSYRNTVMDSFLALSKLLLVLKKKKNPIKINSTQITTSI